jgi:signal transduction histidine kinase
MFRSIRSRLILSFVLIVLVTLSTAGLALYALFRDYREDLTAATLKQVAAPIYYNLTVPSQFTNTQRGGLRLREELLAYIRVQRNETGVYILFIGPNGRVIEDFETESPFQDEHFDVPPPPARGPNFSELQEQRYTTTAGEDLLFVTVPMPQTVRDQEAGVNAIIVAMPASAGPDVARDLRQRLLFAGLIGLTAAAFAGALVWWSLYRPLGRVTRGIRAVARGDFTQRVPESGPSEVKALAADVNTMADSVQKSQRTLRELLANVSHELRTPLTSIRGFAQALLDGTLQTPDERARAATVIESESTRLLQLVGELLDLSRIESGQQEMHATTFQSSELLAHIRDVFQFRAEEAGIELVVAPSPDYSVFADFDRIEQVFGNLVENAVRHSPTGTTITIGARDATSDMVGFFVEDQGSGISPEDLPHVFDRFYRGGSESSGAGSGLGLAISREIVRAHGGSILVEARQGGGSSFQFTLPRAPEPAHAQQVTQASDPSTAGIGETGIQT